MDMFIWLKIHIKRTLNHNHYNEWDTNDKDWVGIFAHKVVGINHKYSLSQRFLNPVQPYDIIQA